MFAPALSLETFLFCSHKASRAGTVMSVVGCHVVTVVVHTHLACLKMTVDVVWKTECHTLSFLCGAYSFWGCNHSCAYWSVSEGLCFIATYAVCSWRWPLSVSFRLDHSQHSAYCTQKLCSALHHMSNVNGLMINDPLKNFLLINFAGITLP